MPGCTQFLPLEIPTGATAFQTLALLQVEAVQIIWMDFLFNVDITVSVIFWTQDTKDEVGQGQTERTWDTDVSSGTQYFTFYICR